MASTFTDTTAYTYQYVDVKQYIADALTGQLPATNFGAVYVFKNDPLDEAKFPAVGINMVSLDEQSTGLGLVTQTPTYDATAQTYTEYQGMYLQETVEVRVFAQNADLRDKLRIFALATLFTLRNTLVQNGIDQIKISGGRDEQDNTLLQSGPLFMNAVLLSYLNPLNVQIQQTNVPAVTDVLPTPTLSDSTS